MLVSQHFDQRIKEFLIVLPSFDRGGVQWAAYLLEAGGFHCASCVMEIKTIFIPLQSAEFYNGPAPVFKVIHQFFVLNFEDRHSECLLPVCHQPVVLAVVLTKVIEIVGKVLSAGEVLKVAGQAGIQWVSLAVNNVRIRKQSFDQAEV